MTSVSVTVGTVTKSVIVSDADMARLLAWMVSNYSLGNPISPMSPMSPMMATPNPTPPSSVPLTQEQAVAAWLLEWMVNTANRQINAERQAVSPINVSEPS
jgi:hypothetical protein